MNNENLNAQGCSLEARVVDGFCVEAFVLAWVYVCSFVIDKNRAKWSNATFIAQAFLLDALVSWAWWACCPQALVLE